MQKMKMELEILESMNIPYEILIDDKPYVHHRYEPRLQVGEQQGLGYNPIKILIGWVMANNGATISQKV